MASALYILFFCSGISGLIYQVVWVRQFGQIFGNTVYSASLVVAVFMLGLGAGSYAFGAWADRRQRAGGNLLTTYAALEAVIAALGIAITLSLPHLSGLVAGLSSYVVDSRGWETLSAGSYLVRGVLTIVLLAPITLLMGGTLTVLVRYVTHASARQVGWAVALLYGVNTLGAAAGAFLTDFAFIPWLGLQGTQFVAAGLNVAAAAGALRLSRLSGTAGASVPEYANDADLVRTSARIVKWTAAALALSGFAALGTEILWLRHLTILLGGFRAIFSLLLAVMLLALGAGALLGGWLDRRFGHPALLLILIQALFAISMLLGIASVDAVAIATRAAAYSMDLVPLTSLGRRLLELWFDVQPMLFEIAVPAFIGGCAFPLANAIVQRAETVVGRRAGILYAANTVGAVCGSLLTGYLLLPVLGMQLTAAALAAIAALSIIPLHLARSESDGPPATRILASAGALTVTAIVAWLLLPADFLLQRTLPRREPSERILTVSEGVNELLAVVEMEGRGRGLLTNGHAMSSTARLDQRYMRALAHVPLLSMRDPRRVLVIGFGVGNTTQAATLYPSVERVEVADLSRNILDHADYFAEANKDVLHNPKVSVFINDGRMHLQMAPSASYDLITLEPPPIAHAGVAALYSREFYELAKSRLKAGGYVSQWLPAYQVPAESSLAMVRAFIDVFPNSVLLSGAQAELILLGTTAPKIEIDPTRIQQFIATRPAVRDDLAAVDLGTPRDIAAMFVGSADTLTRATQASVPMQDDRPVQESGVLSILSTSVLGVPGSLFELTAAPAWCPACYVGGDIAPAVAGLDLNFALLQQTYLSSPASTRTAIGQSFATRKVLGSAYLGSVVPDTAEVHNIIGIADMRDGRVDDAIAQFEAALSRDPRSTAARANLGQIRYDQASAFMEERRYADAVPLLRVAVNLTPDDEDAQNDLGVALASLGSVDEAVTHFERAVELKPDFPSAQRNLAAARALLRQR